MQYVVENNVHDFHFTAYYMLIIKFSLISETFDVLLTFHRHNAIHFKMAA